jgi:hypothetical protein
MVECAMHNFANGVDSLAFLRYISPFHYFGLNRPLDQGDVFRFGSADAVRPQARRPRRTHRCWTSLSSFSPPS